MNILSKFTDYYDGVKTYGIDKTVVYLRNRSEPEGMGLRFDLPGVKEATSVIRSVKHQFIIKYYILGFCGQLYPFIVVDRTEVSATPQPFKRTVLFKDSDAREYLSKWELYGGDMEKPLHVYRGYKLADVGFFEPEYVSHLNHLHLTTLFVKYRVPVWIIGPTTKVEKKYNSSSWPNHFILNPKLKDYQIVNLIPPQQAFQSIYMYLSGVLGQPEKVILEVDNKHKILAHGMDKTSFRKPKGTKRGKPQWR